MNRRPMTLLVPLAGVALLGAACTAQTNATSPSAGATSSNPSVTTARVSAEPNVPLSSWCGDKTLKVGVADGFGGNAWRTISLNVIKEEAAKCPAISKNILYTNAGGDQQKAISDINSLVAEGVNVLVVYPDFGPAELPAIRAAKKAGVDVVPYDASVGGTPGVDYTATTVSDAYSGGETLANWVGKTVKTGNVIFLGGIPGAPTSAQYMAGIKTALKQYPGMKLLVNQPVVTNWTKVGAQTAVTGLIARYNKIDAVITDYGVTAVAAIDAFTAAGKKIPAIASLATDNELGCTWQADSKGANKFPIFSIDGTNDMAQLALRQGVAAANGKSYHAMQLFELPVFMDSTAGKNPLCVASLPPDADLSSPLSQAQLTAILH